MFFSIILWKLLRKWIQENIVYEEEKKYSSGHSGLEIQKALPFYSYLAVDCCLPNVKLTSLIWTHKLKQWLKFHTQQTLAKTICHFNNEERSGTESKISWNSISEKMVSCYVKRSENSGIKTSSFGKFKSLEKKVAKLPLFRYLEIPYGPYAMNSKQLFFLPVLLLSQ